MEIKDEEAEDPQERRPSVALQIETKKVSTNLHFSVNVANMVKVSTNGRILSPNLKQITVQAHICVAKAITKYEDRILSDSLLEEMRYTVNMDN